MKRLSKANPYLHFQTINSPCHNLLFQGIENGGRQDNEEEEDDEFLGDNWLDVEENLEQLIQLL